MTILPLYLEGKNPIVGPNVLEKRKKLLILPEFEPRTVHPVA
jgi:hypothetical protein